MRYIIFSSILLVALACAKIEKHDHDKNHLTASESPGQEIHLTRKQATSIGLETGTLTQREMTGAIETIGELEVPPQSHAVVSAMIGANIESIEVLEGTRIRKNGVLAYLAHPALIDLQTGYAQAVGKLHYLQQEFERRRTLYESEIESGQSFQKIQAEYVALHSKVKADSAKLRLLGLDPTDVKSGEIFTSIPLRSPIGGYVKYVHVNSGQFIEPQTPAFEVVDISHIHADFMVYEKDISKVRKGQTVRFVVQTLPGRELTAKVFAVGKAFEEDPKAVHVHAEIDNKDGILIPGMYVSGEFLLDVQQTAALPESAVVREGDRHFTFVLVADESNLAHKNGRDVHVHNQDEEGQHQDHGEIRFRAVEVIPGTVRHGWVAVTLVEDVSENTLFVQNNAYYLMAEMKKGEAEHSH